MKIKNFLGRIKTYTAATEAELTIVGILLLGLTIGAVVKSFDKNEQNNQKVNSEVFRILDSLAESARMTYSSEEKRKNSPSSENLSNSTQIDNNIFALSGTKKLSKAEKLKNYGKININNAPKSELKKLPGIGDKTADLIINYRINNKFNTISDILKIKGIGPKKFDALKDYIEVK